MNNQPEKPEDNLIEFRHEEDSFSTPVNHKPVDSSNMTKDQMRSRIEELKVKLTGDMFADMHIRDEIHNLQMKIDGSKPMNSQFECHSCGS